MAKRQKNTARSVVAAEKRKAALELRKEGWTFEVIGKKLGMGRALAWKVVQKGIRDLPKAAAQEVLDMELYRLDELMTFLWKKAQKGDLQAVDRILRIMVRRANYLGLDAPKAQHVQLETVQTIASQFDERSAADNEYYAQHGFYPEEAPLEVSDADAPADPLKGLH